MKKNLVSVIIPTYNRGEFVKDAIASVIRQTYDHFEMLLIDDGSTDDTAQMVKGISDSRIKYFYKQNGGVASARNYGICEAAGEYLAFLDDDDLWPKEYLEVMVAALEKNPDHGLVYCQFKNYRQDGTIKNGFEHSQNFSGWFTEQYYKKTLYFLPSCFAVRKEICKDFWFDEVLKNCADRDFFLRLSAITKFLFVDNICIQRRITEGSLSDIKFNYNQAFVLERFYDYFGGKKLVPAGIARRGISKQYRELARKHYLRGNRKASICLYVRAISRCPWEPKNYKGLRKALFLSKKNDKSARWRMPEPLPGCITVSDVNGVSYA